MKESSNRTKVPFHLRIKNVKYRDPPKGLTYVPSKGWYYFESPTMGKLWLPKYLVPDHINNMGWSMAVFYMYIEAKADHAGYARVNLAEAARHLGVTRQAVQYWFRRLKGWGFVRELDPSNGRRRHMADNLYDVKASAVERLVRAAIYNRDPAKLHRLVWDLVEDFAARLEQANNGNGRVAPGFGERLTAWMAKHNVTVRSLARALAASEKSVTEWRSGAHLPSARHLRTLRRVLRNNADWVLAGKGRLIFDPPRLKEWTISCRPPTEGFNVRLREWMRRNGITVSGLAREVGVHAKTVGRWVRGSNSPCNAHTIHALMRAIGEKAEWVLYGK